MVNGQLTKELNLLQKGLKKKSKELLFFKSSGQPVKKKKKNEFIMIFKGIFIQYDIKFF